MPRLSLWRPKKSLDYIFMDKTISEMFTVGATDLYIHKYIGSNNPSNTQDFTQPFYDQTDPTNIQDLLFLENRDRKYDPNIYRLRGHYNVANLDFDLSQFGLFLTNDIIFITVHYNDMIDIIGRKLMVGDVFELPHLVDYHPLNNLIPIGLRRYYQITDANFASEGFSQTWWPHLWRIKCEPLVDSQEFADILNAPIYTDNYMGDWDPTKSYQPGYTVTWGDKIYTPTQPVPPGVSPPDPTYWVLSTEQNLRDIIGRYNKNIEINQAVLDEAARLVPKSGYDVSQLYVVPTFVNNEPAPPVDIIEYRENTPSGSPGLSIETIHNPKYTTPSKVVRINKSNNAPNVIKNTIVVFSTGYVSPEVTESGSGAMVGNMVAVTTMLGSPVSVPYGTADNTYATADQFINFIVTAEVVPQSTLTFTVQTIPDWLTVGLPVRCNLISENGTPTQIWPLYTTITAFDSVLKTITVDNATRSTIPIGYSIEVSFTFNDVVSQDMDYRADCDPRFLFIRRKTPRSFGWLAGYLTGTEQAPNGEPCGSGINFPADPREGDYFLRLDYLPQKLFRFDGNLWVEISRNVRTPPTLELDDQSQISTFFNNPNVVPTAQGGTIPSRQGLSNILKITPD